MAVGTCVNLAARLMSHAEPNSVIVGPTCHAAAERYAIFEDLGELPLKGLGMVAGWRFIGLTGDREGRVPLIGREAELEKLRAAFDRAAAGHASLVLLIGPPGIGKSRIVEEFARAVGGEATVLEARCRPGTEVGSSPLRQLLPDPPVDAIPSAVAHSAGIRSDPRLLALSAMDRRTEIQGAWREYFVGLTAHRPVVIRIEDLHWAESELVRLIDWLTRASELSLLMVATARPEFPGMPLLRPSDRTLLELQALDPGSAAALARAAGARDIHVERAEGQPLFIVELARANRDSGAPLPVTVQAAIGARLDELARPDRELLQTSAIIGETFDVQGAALLAERDPSDVAGALGRLSHLRYVHPVDGAFRFDHALVHDIAYGRLPVGTRLHLHAQYAREGLHAEDVETLAHHWWEALGPAEAEWVWENDPELEHMRVAAMRAHLGAARSLSERFANDRATETFERALRLARGPQEQAEIEEAFGLACARNAKGDEATERRLRAVELYQQAGQTPPAGLYADTLNLLVFNWGYFQKRTSVSHVTGLIDDGLRVARAAGDSPALLRLLVQRGAFTDDPTVLPEITAILGAAPDQGPYADALWPLAVFHLVVTRDIAKALEALDLAFALRERGAHFNVPEALFWRSSAYFHAGQLARAEADADTLIAMARTLSPHTRQHAMATKSRVLLARGDWSGVNAQAADLRALALENPEATFCLAGANLAAYDAVAFLIEGGTAPEDLGGFVTRLVPEATATRAGALLLPHSMTGTAPVEEEEEARRSYSSETPIFDREAVWDVTGAQHALADVVRGRWGEVAAALPAIDETAGHGARFAAAFASALREEISASQGGPKPAHADLRALGYAGVSELLSYRVR